MTEEKKETKEVIAAQQVTLPCGAEVRRVRQVVIDYTDDGYPIYDDMEC